MKQAWLTVHSQISSQLPLNVNVATTTKESTESIEVTSGDVYYDPYDDTYKPVYGVQPIEQPKAVTVNNEIIASLSDNQPDESGAVQVPPLTTECFSDITHSVSQTSAQESLLQHPIDKEDELYLSTEEALRKESIILPPAVSTFEPLQAQDIDPYSIYDKPTLNLEDTNTQPKSDTTTSDQGIYSSVESTLPAPTKDPLQLPLTQPVSSTLQPTPQVASTQTSNTVSQPPAQIQVAQEPPAQMQVTQPNKTQSDIYSASTPPQSQATQQHAVTAETEAQMCAARPSAAHSENASVKTSKSSERAHSMWMKALRTQYQEDETAIPASKPQRSWTSAAHTTFPEEEVQTRSNSVSFQQGTKEQPEPQQEEEEEEEVSEQRVGRVVIVVVYQHINTC